MIKMKIQVLGSKAVANQFKAKRANFDTTISNAIKKSAGLIENSAKENCPSKTGKLKSSIHSEFSKKGFEARIGPDETTAPYAYWVEVGHKQTPGRYVHAIRRRLVASFVRGHWFMSKAYIANRRKVVSEIERAFNNAITK